MKSLLFLALALCPFVEVLAQKRVKTIHVIVALCDNKSQGIVPVPAKLGNGDDPANNLYWGALYGVRTHFRKSADWTLLTTIAKPETNILERCIFVHSRSKTYLVADAYQGKAMKAAINHFLTGTAGNKPKLLSAVHKEKRILLRLTGAADLNVFVGHNGLMDFRADMPKPAKRRDEKRQAMILCCKSNAYFSKPLASAKATGLLTTYGLMAPEGYVLHAALAGWIADEGSNAIRVRAAKAYGKYQKCSVRAGMRLFGAR